MTGFTVPGFNVAAPGVDVPGDVVPGDVVPGDDGSLFLAPALPGPLAPGPVGVRPAAPAAPGPVVVVPAAPGLPPGCCEKPGSACEGVPGLDGAPALDGVPGVPGAPAALGGVPGRISTTGLPGFAAMTPGPFSRAGCGVAATAGCPWFFDRESEGSLAAVCMWRVCSCVGGMWRSLANASCCGVGLAAIPPAPPLKLALDVLFTTTVLL